VPEVHAVELADGDAAGAALGVGEPGDAHRARSLAAVRDPTGSFVA
jgi:hypothetical protein